MVDFFFTITFVVVVDFFTRNQKQNNQHCVTCYVISMVYTLICKQALKQSKIKCYFKKMLLNPSGFKSSLRIHARLSLFITSVAVVLKLQSNGYFC